MGRHKGKGRNVEPVNFNKELFIKFNGPAPGPDSESLISCVVTQKRLDRQNELQTCFISNHPNRLKFIGIGATIGNLRSTLQSSCDTKC